MDQRVNRRRSLDHAERYVRNLLAAFGEDRALDVTADRIEVYRDQRLADGLAPASVNRELAALRHMFKLAVRKGKLPASRTWRPSTSPETSARASSNRRSSKRFARSSRGTYKTRPASRS